MRRLPSGFLGFDGNGEYSYFDYQLAVALQDGQRQGASIQHVFDRSWFQTHTSWVRGGPLDVAKNFVLQVPSSTHPIASICLVLGGFSNLDSCAEYRAFGVGFREGFDIRIDCINARWLG
ncbi:MAG: hypothetical protein H6704_25540 [Myxococcales bacterium]|nr:hypothetical protein [Myxococcales bacterium]